MREPQTWSKVDSDLHRGILPRTMAADRKVFGRVYLHNIMTDGIFQGFIAK